MTTTTRTEGHAVSSVRRGGASHLGRRSGEYVCDAPAPTLSDIPVDVRIPTSVLCLVIFVVLAMAVGCGGPAGEAQGGQSSSRPEIVRCSDEIRPLRLVVVQDKSKSGSRMRTPQLSWPDLMTVLSRVRKTGGEIAVGIIDSSSNSSLVRVRIDEPPLPPDPVEEEGNVLYRAQDLKEYRADSADYAERYQVWSEKVKRGLTHLESRLDTLLARPANAMRTDIWGAVSRSAYFLEEPGHWRCEPREVAVIISDAVDNQGVPSVAWPASAELFLVNGAPSLGALEELDPTRFESIESALRYVVESDAR